MSRVPQPCFPALSADTILASDALHEAADPHAVPVACGGGEDLARRRYNSPLSPLHGQPPEVQSGFRGLPHHTGQLGCRVLRWAFISVGHMAVLNLIACGRSFVTEAHHTGADVRSLTEVLIAHAQGLLLFRPSMTRTCPARPNSALMPGSATT
jgi:hypothetical protein